MEKPIFDFVIIGANTESLLLGNALTAVGKSVIVIEPSPVANFQTDPFLPILNSTEFTNQMTSEEDNSEPIVFEKSEFQQFLGFGENAPAYYEWLMPYLKTPKRIVTALPQPNFTVMCNSTVSSLESEDNRIHSLIINGKDKIVGYQFISTISPLKILKWSKNFSSKLLQRWSKLPLWTTLVLDLTHKTPITDQTAMQILRGNKNELCIGYFKNNVSRWMSFVPADDEIDTEVVGSQYREMKRLISKAYPECFQSLNFEKLTVISEGYGHINFKMAQENPLSPFKNLWLCNTKLNNEFNLLEGALFAARELLNDFGSQGSYKPNNSNNLESSATL